MDLYENEKVCYSHITVQANDVAALCKYLQVLDRDFYSVVLKGEERHF